MVQVFAGKTNSPDLRTEGYGGGRDTFILVLGALLTTGVALLAEVSSLIPAGVAAAVVIAGAAVVAMRDFWTFILLTLAIRPALDAFTTDDPTKSSIEPSAVVGAALLLMTALWLIGRHRSGKKLHVSVPTGCICTMMAFIMVSSLASMKFASITVAIKLLSATLLLIAFEQFFEERPSRINQAIGALLISAVVPFVMAVNQVFNGGSDVGYHPIGVEDRVQGSFVHPSVLAYFCLVILWTGFMSLYLRRWRHRRGLLVLVCLSAAPILVLTYTRGAWIALVAGVVYVGVVLQPKLLAGRAVVVVLVLLLVPSVTARCSDLQSTNDAVTNTPNSMAWRVQYWGRILPFGERSPIVGVGLGIMRQTPNYGYEPHSIYVQSFVEGGVFVSASLLAAIVASTLAVRKVRRRSRSQDARVIAVMAAGIGIGFLVEGFTDNLLTQVPLVYAMFVPLGWIFAASRAPEAFDDYEVELVSADPSDAEMALSAPTAS